MRSWNTSKLCDIFRPPFINGRPQKTDFIFGKALVPFLKWKPPFFHLHHFIHIIKRNFRHSLHGSAWPCSVLLTRPWQTYQFSFFMPYISITPLNYWQSTENSLKWWAASSKENFGTSWKLFTCNVKKLAFLRIKNAKFMTFLTLSGNSGNSVDRHDGMFTKKFFCYFTRNKSVWLRFPASPWMNLWMIFLNSL